MMMYDPYALKKYKERKINKEFLAKFRIQESYQFL